MFQTNENPNEKEKESILQSGTKKSLGYLIGMSSVLKSEVNTWTLTNQCLNKNKGKYSQS